MTLAAWTAVTTTDDLQRLGARIRAARTARGLKASEAATQARMSPTTWGEIERGTSALRRPLTYAAVEKVVGWAPGSVAQVLAGGEPVPGSRHGEGATDTEVDHITAWETEIVTEIWDNPLLSDDVKEDLTARARTKVAELRAIQDRLRRSAG